jgi:hypothetical protein
MHKRYKEGDAVDSTVMERIQKLEKVGFVWSLAPGEDDDNGDDVDDESSSGSSHDVDTNHTTGQSHSS